MSPRATLPGSRRSVGRAALRLETGRATCRSRTAQDSSLSAVEMGLNARGSCERAGPIGWGEPVTLAKKWPVLAAWAARGNPPGATWPTTRTIGWTGRFGQEGTPGLCSGRPRSAGRDSGATLGREAPPRAIEIGGSSIIRFARTAACSRGKVAAGTVPNTTPAGARPQSRRRTPEAPFRVFREVRSEKREDIGTFFRRTTVQVQSGTVTG
jgi:hypothetical protein